MDVLANCSRARSTVDTFLLPPSSLVVASDVGGAHSGGPHPFWTMRPRAGPQKRGLGRGARGGALVSRSSRLRGAPVTDDRHYDVIIIGTGAGGGTLAHRLAPSGKQVLLLERGDYLPRERDNWSSTAVFVNGKYRAPEF